MKKIIKFNRPETLTDGNQTNDYIDFVLDEFEIVKGDFSPEFISFENDVKEIKPNGLYIGSNIKVNRSKYETNGSFKFTNVAFNKLFAEKNIPFVQIPLGNFSLYTVVPNNGHPSPIFSFFSRSNTVAMVDLFLLLHSMKNTDNYSKLRAMLKVLFSYYEKSFVSRKLEKSSQREIQEELNKIWIGSDPEFTLIKKSNPNNFYNAFQHIKSQADFVIGADGHQSILELRPNASNDIDKFINNVEELVIETSELVDDNDYEILTGGGLFEGESLGGHIHFSGLNSSKEVISLLDQFIGIPLKNCKNGKRARANVNYDLEGQIRLQQYGDEGTILGFEYRTPPSFYADPMLTRATYIVAMQLAKTAKYLRKTRDMITIECPPTHDDYKKLYEYERYKKYIDYFYDFVSKKSDLCKPVFETWGIKEIKLPFTESVEICKTNDKLMNDIIQSTSVKIYRPIFKKIEFYGIAESNAPFSVININSQFIDTNVCMGWLHRWMRDFIGDVSIINYYQNDDFIKDFIKNGILHIGLSIRFREYLLKLEEQKLNFSSEIIKTFLKRLCVYTRIVLKDSNSLDLSQEDEVKEFETIKKISKL